MKEYKSTSRISFTAHYTGYTWYANGLSNKILATIPGACFFYYLKSPAWIFKKIFGINDIEEFLIQRHKIIDHLLEQAILKQGVRQVLEIACGLSPRGYRFMRETSKDMLYIETDLPGMANLKRAKFKKAGYNNENHLVIDCDIFSTEGKLCLENIIEKYMDHKVPAVIITEGLVNYFDINKMKNMWQRIFNILNTFPASTYLTDNMPDLVDHPNYYLIKAGKFFLTIVTRGNIYTHFRNDDESEMNFRSLGFNRVNIHHPESYTNILSIPASRKPSTITVIEAIV